MKILNRFPRLLRWIFSVVLILLAVMTFFRFLFYWTYNPPGKAFSGSAFIMGLRFDARMACIAGLFILLLCALPFINPFKNLRAKKFWNFLLPFIFVILLLFYGADYYHFDYLHQRLNASVISYLEDAGISFSLMWQTYPLLKIAFAIILLATLAWFIFRKLLNYLQQQVVSNKKRVGFYIISFLLLGIIIFGKIGQFPLRWSDAYTLSDDYKANLALNPFQSFFSSLGFRNSGYDRKKVKEYYPLMASYLGVQQPDSNRLIFERKSTRPDSVGYHPNVVLIICESFSAYKSSMFGNPLNTTPYFSEMCKNGIFFDRCFSPAYGTARGVWATITGIPDVESPGTASRNLNMVDQHSIINDFNGYSKFYFLGGDPTWANIQGVLMNNLPGLNMYDGQRSNAKKIDVWGISDKDLLLESNNVLKQQSGPFFAIIQTADNHRPYTIPEEDRDAFTVVTTSEDSLHRFGFESNKEMNAFRYTDFCYRKFMEAAKKETYFDNTIFIFVGDHGIRGNAGELFPKSWTEQGLTCEHVPLLFYAPKMIQPKRIHDICSQVDILPSVASMAKIPYRNTTFGRDLFDTARHFQFQESVPAQNHAFIFDEGLKTIGIISDNYYFFKNLRSGKQDLVSVSGSNPVPANPQTDSIRQYLGHLTDAWYETARYMLLNNRKQ